MAWIYTSGSGLKQISPDVIKIVLQQTNMGEKNYFTRRIIIIDSKYIIIN